MALGYRNYSDQDIISKAAEVKSLAQLLRSLNLKVAGGNYINMRRNLQRLQINTAHWSGQGWNKDKQLKDWQEYTRAHRIRPHLIRQRGHRCEKCGLEKWFEKPIGLEIHHIDGDRTNNNPTNIKLLCGNCHNMTKGFRNRKH